MTDATERPPLSAPFAFQAQKKNDWNDCARDYARYSRQIGFYKGITESLLQLMPENVTSLVDFGCGDGRFARACLNRDKLQPAAVYLIDKAQEMLALTTDLTSTFPATEFVRIQNEDELVSLPRATVKACEAFACNSSFHLVRDISGFAERAFRLLNDNGCFIANIPDQDFLFQDGWRSEFSHYANQLMPCLQRQAIPPKFSEQVLCSIAKGLNCDLHVTSTFFPVAWADFISFYSIPFMGARRLPELDQRQRVQYLSSLPPAFEVIQYRWVFLKLIKPA